MYNRQYNRMPEYEKHIRDEREYRDAVNNLRKGERFKYDELVNRSDYEQNERYTPYDYAYMVNALYTDYDISEKSEPYKKMAKEHLKNDSFPERGGERAYYDAQQRARRYYNTYENYDRYDNRYEYENRRGYDRRADRDNDGRYNER